MYVSVVLFYFSNFFADKITTYKPTYLRTPDEYFFKTSDPADAAKAVANDTIFSSVFPKCCQPNFSYDSENRECVQSGPDDLNIYDLLKLDVNVIKSGLRACQVIVDKYVKKRKFIKKKIKKEDPVRLRMNRKSFSLFCLDNVFDNKDDFVIRYCQGKEYCYGKDGWCLPKCCKDGVGFLNDKCTLTQRNGLRTKNSDQLFKVKGDFALLSDMAVCNNGSWHDLHNLNFSIKGNGSIFITDDYAVREYKVDQYCLETSRYTNSELVKEIAMFCDLADSNIIYKMEARRDTVPESSSISILASTRKSTSTTGRQEEVEKKLTSGLLLNTNWTTPISHIGSIYPFRKSSSEVSESAIEVQNASTTSIAIVDLPAKSDDQVTVTTTFSPKDLVERPSTSEMTKLELDLSSTQSVHSQSKKNGQVLTTISEKEIELTSDAVTEMLLRSNSKYATYEELKISSMLPLRSTPNQQEELTTIFSVESGNSALSHELSGEVSTETTKETLGSGLDMFGTTSQMITDLDTTTEMLFETTIEEIILETSTSAEMTESITEDDETSKPTSKVVQERYLTDKLFTPGLTRKATLTRINKFTWRKPNVMSAAPMSEDTSTLTNKATSTVEHEMTSETTEGSTWYIKTSNEIEDTSLAQTELLKGISDTETIKALGCSASVLEEIENTTMNTTLTGIEILETLPEGIETTFEPPVDVDVTQTKFLSTEPENVEKEVSNATVITITSDSEFISDSLLNKTEATESPDDSTQSTISESISQMTTNVNVDTATEMSFQPSLEEIKLETNTPPLMTNRITDDETYSINELTSDWTPETTSTHTLKFTQEKPEDVTISPILEDTSILTNEATATIEYGMISEFIEDSTWDFKTLNEVESTSVLLTESEEVSSVDGISTTETARASKSTETTTDSSPLEIEDAGMDSVKTEILSERSETTFEPSATEIEILNTKFDSEFSSDKLAIKTEATESVDDSTSSTMFTLTSEMAIDTFSQMNSHDGFYEKFTERTYEYASYSTEGETRESSSDYTSSYTSKVISKLEDVVSDNIFTFLSESVSTMPSTPQFSSTQTEDTIGGLKTSILSKELSSTGRSELESEVTSTDTNLDLTTKPQIISQTSHGEIIPEVQTNPLVHQPSDKEESTTESSIEEIKEKLTTSSSVTLDFRTLPSTLPSKKTSTVTPVLSESIPTSVATTKTSLHISKEPVVDLTSNTKLFTTSEMPFGKASTNVDETTVKLTPTDMATVVPPLLPSTLMMASDTMIFLSLVCYLITITVHVFIYKLQKVTERLACYLCFVDLLFLSAYIAEVYVDDFGKFNNIFGYSNSLLLISRASWLNVLLFEIKNVISKKGMAETSNRNTMVYYTLYALIIPTVAIISLILSAEGVYSSPESYRPQINEKGIVDGGTSYGYIHLYIPVAILNAVNVGIFLGIMHHFRAVKIDDYQNKNELILKIIKAGLLIIVATIISYCEYTKSIGSSVTMKSVEEINIVAEGLIFVILFSIRPRRIYEAVKRRR